jgi:periplasmic protein CpxP/Spy
MAQSYSWFTPSGCFKVSALSRLTPKQYFCEESSMKAITKISLISGLLASSLALADPKPNTYTDSRECGRGAHSKMMKDQSRFLDRMADRLKLTGEQRASIKTVMETSKPQMAHIKEKMQANRKALRDLRRAKNIDEGQVEQLAYERGNLVASMIIERTKVRSEIRQVLTDAQREQMRQMRENRWEAIRDKCNGCENKRLNESNFDGTY